MALNIRNPEASRLAAEVAALAGENKTEAVILALRERLQRLRQRQSTTTEAQCHLVDQLDRLALRCASRSILDQRSSDEILGYDNIGLPS